MNEKIRFAAVALLVMMMLTACGEDVALTQFRKEIDDFCFAISEIDTSINNINAQADSDTAVQEVLRYLDDLDEEFKQFAELDFPEEFDYLESLADEASEYMTEAVSSFHEVYSNDSYTEAMVAAEYEYARENYSRAYKRIQIIITFLHGEEPEDVDLNIN